MTRSARILFLIVTLLVLSPAARASVSFTVVLDGLVEESNAACVVTPALAKSVWENGRIYTYTQVRVERTLAGTVSGAEVWVQTMGGTVGEIGQLVDGEAVLIPGKTSLLFLKAAPTTSSFGGYVVTARGQGQFPVVTDATTHALKLMRNAHAGALLAPNPRTVARLRAAAPSVAASTLPAGDVLDGKSIDDAAVELARAWSRTHAP